MNNRKLMTLPADTDKPCSCCGRTHRKLYFYGGYWMGRSCLEDFEVYQNWPKRESFVWHGHEAAYDKVHRMVTAR